MGWPLRDGASLPGRRVFDCLFVSNFHYFRPQRLLVEHLRRLELEGRHFLDQVLVVLKLGDVEHVLLDYPSILRVPVDGVRISIALFFAIQRLFDPLLVVADCLQLLQDRAARVLGNRTARRLSRFVRHSVVFQGHLGVHGCIAHWPSLITEVFSKSLQVLVPAAAGWRDLERGRQCHLLVAALGHLLVRCRDGVTIFLLSRAQQRYVAACLRYLASVLRRQERQAFTTRRKAAWRSHLRCFIISRVPVLNLGELCIFSLLGGAVLQHYGLGHLKEGARRRAQLVVRTRRLDGVALRLEACKVASEQLLVEGRLDPLHLPIVQTGFAGLRPCPLELRSRPRKYPII